MIINSKRADFVLLDADLNVALVIEYQGKGHFGNSRDSRARAQKSDTVKRQALREAGIGLVELPAKFDRAVVVGLVADETGAGAEALAGDGPSDSH